MHCMARICVVRAIVAHNVAHIDARRVAITRTQWPNCPPAHNCPRWHRCALCRAGIACARSIAPFCPRCALSLALSLARYECAQFMPRCSYFAPRQSRSTCHKMPVTIMPLITLQKYHTCPPDARRVAAWPMLQMQRYFQHVSHTGSSHHNFFLVTNYH